MLFPDASTLDESYGKDYRGHPGDRPPARWLRDTPLLQLDHPKVRLLAIRLTQLRSGQREKAIACFEFVRKLAFTCPMDAVKMLSTEVLAARTGDGFSKSTLFIALLRSAGIPARLRMVLLRPAYLRGISGVGGRFVEHAFTEVLVQDEWLAVDSYVVDLQLGLKARARLLDEGRRAGYGIHLKGQLSWDACSSSFGQFSVEDPDGLPVLDLGAHDDVQQFYRSLAPRSPTEWANRSRWSLASVMANRRIHKLRAWAAPPVEKAARTAAFG
ncbi:MAG: hypothetical protein JWQ07_2000 [Ramlibacter sp.]|nr:hypothetical protein [Ramlibacter sp.]